MGAGWKVLTSPPQKKICVVCKGHGKQAVLALERLAGPKKPLAQGRQDALLGAGRVPG
jgi:hypothetical protein